MMDTKNKKSKAIVQQTVIARTEHKLHQGRKTTDVSLGERSKICRLLLPSKVESKN